jgi:BirA family transcriptional regulator, biotin operon repressor / biotin---[acetyl-CoA-carboxylase] ligase
MNIIHIRETISTNSFLRDWSNTHPEADETVVFANTQTAGRGQRGNGWESEPDKNATMSLLLKPKFVPADQQFILSQVVSLAIAETLSGYTQEITVKWPNDIYYRDKKICGMLIENDITDGIISRSIIGIGVNINQQQFVSDAPNPISLSQITGKEHDIEEIVSNMASGIIYNYYLLKSSPEWWTNFQEKYTGFLYRKEGFHLFATEKETFRARIHHVEPSGLLVLERVVTGEKEAFAFKEVKFVLH